MHKANNKHEGNNKVQGTKVITSVKVTTRHKGARAACAKVVARHEVQR